MTKLTREEKRAMEERDIADLLDNEDLTDKQRLFCIYYTQCFNATKAYKKAYGCDHAVANTNGARLLGNARIKAEIRKLKQGKLSRANVSEDDIFQQMLNIAFADLTDYVEFGKREIETEFGTKVVSYVDLKESTEVDGSIISEVSQGKDGVKVKLYDKMRALQWLGDRLNLVTTVDKERLRIAQERLELDKVKDSDIDDEIKITIVKKEERE